MSEFDQKKFNIYTVRVLQHLLDTVDNFNKDVADDFGVLCELLWTYDPDYHSSNQGENMISMKLHPPTYCPACGSTNIESVVGKNSRGSAIHDTYCKVCEWSGDISPDSDLRIKVWVNKVHSSNQKVN